MNCALLVQSTRTSKIQAPQKRFGNLNSLDCYLDHYCHDEKIENDQEFNVHTLVFKV